MKERIFFDNNATTKIADEVLQSMIKAYGEPLNPSSIHYFGRTATRISNQAREHIKKLLGAEKKICVVVSLVEFVLCLA